MKSRDTDFENYQEWYDHETAANTNEMDFWFCNEDEWANGDRGLCDRAFYTEEKFEAHYQTDHPEASELFKR
jgi:hypothetical protein